MAPQELPSSPEPQVCDEAFYVQEIGSLTRLEWHLSGSVSCLARQGWHIAGTHLMYEPASGGSWGPMGLADGEAVTGSLRGCRSGAGCEESREE